MSRQKDKEYHHGFEWLCLSCMVVSSLTLLSLLRPMRRDRSRRMSDDADNRPLLSSYHRLHDISLLLALLIRCLDTTMRSCSVSRPGVVVLWQEEAVTSGSGRRIVLPALGAYQVRDGQVAKSRMFQDTAAIQDLLAEAERKQTVRRTKLLDKQHPSPL